MVQPTSSMLLALPQRLVGPAKYQVVLTRSKPGHFSPSAIPWQDLVLRGASWLYAVVPVYG